MRREIILSAAAVAALLWSGESTAPRMPDKTAGDRLILVDVFRSVEDCAAASGIGHAACLAGERTAWARHERFGPKFGTRALCEARFGAGGCVVTHSHSATPASPAPVGFLLCRAGPRGCRSPAFAPVYRTVPGFEFTVTGGGIARRISAYAGRFRVSRLSVDPTDIS